MKNNDNSLCFNPGLQSHLQAFISLSCALISSFCRGRNWCQMPNSLHTYHIYMCVVDICTGKNKERTNNEILYQVTSPTLVQNYLWMNKGWRGSQHIWVYTGVNYNGIDVICMELPPDSCLLSINKWLLHLLPPNLMGRHSNSSL